MTAEAHDVCSVVVLIVCADRNFQRFARTILRQAGHTPFVTGVRASDAAVQVRLRAPHVVLLDDDHQEADSIRRILGRTAVVTVSDDPVAIAAGAVGKWDGAPAMVAAVEEAANAARRRSLLRLVQP